MKLLFFIMLAVTNCASTPLSPAASTSGGSGLNLYGKMFTLSAYEGGLIIYSPYMPSPWSSPTPYSSRDYTPRYNYRLFMRQRATPKYPTSPKAPFTPTEEPYTSNEEPYTPNEEPYTSNEEPYTSNEEPYAPNEEPYTPNEEPYTPTEEPYTPNEEPYTSNEEPYTPNEEPYTPNEEPYTPTEEPYTSNEEPYTSTEEPYTSTEEPYTPNEEPYTPNEEPYTPTEEPYTPNEEPYTPNEEPYTLNEEPYTPNEEPYTPNEEPYTPTEEPYTPNEEPYTLNEEPYTPNEEPYTPNEEPYTSNEEPYTSNEELYTSNEEPYTSNEEPYTPNEEPYTPNEEPYTPNEEPYTSNEEPYTPTEEPYTPNEEPYTPTRAPYTTRYPTTTSWTTAPSTRGVSVCLRYIIDSEGFPIFTLSPSSTPLRLRSNGPLSYTLSFNGYSSTYLQPSIRLWSDMRQNMWTSVCITMDTMKKVVQMFRNSNMSSRKLLPSQYTWSGEPVIDFSGFEGQVTDVQVWDYPLLYKEVLYYMSSGFYGQYQGSVLSWFYISYSVRGKTLLEENYEQQMKLPSDRTTRGRRLKWDKKPRKGFNFHKSKESRKQLM